MPQNYKVEVTPLVRNDLYGDKVDISGSVEVGGIGKIRIGIDDNDFDVGIFNLGFIDLEVINFDGFFSAQDYYRTGFIHTRDKAIVEVTHIDTDSSETKFFTGFINDEFTREDFESGTVKFKILSKDSIFRKIFVDTGTIQGGQTALEIVTALLNRPSVTNFVNYNPSNINLAFNPTIDVVEDIENVSMRTALNKVLLASGSILYIDRDDNIIIKDRTELQDKDYFHFYGAGDRLERTNFISIENYNTGLQRAFNGFKIGDKALKDDDVISVFNLREKSLDLDDIITDENTKDTILNYYLDNFKIPKKEFELVCRTKDIKDLYVFDPVTVAYQGKSRGINQDSPACYGVSRYGDSTYAIQLSSQSLSDNIGYKIIAIETLAKDFVSIVKLREIGKTASDSQLNYWEDEQGNILVDDNFNRFFFE
jgi:hypothetical protein